MSQERHHCPLLIVGGGIGGVATALALARTGRRVRLIERASEFGEIGAGLQLAPNAMRVLDELGVLPAVEAAAVIPERLSLVDIFSAELLKVVDTGRSFVERFGYRYVLIHRSDLLQILLDACRATGLVTLEAAKEVVEVTDHGSSAEVRCADGTLYVCDALIAADGLWSLVRRTLFDDKPPEPNHYVAYRGTIPAVARLPHSGPSDLVFWVGPQMHLVQYPLRHQQLFNQVLVFKSNRYTPDNDDWGTVAELEERFGVAHDLVKGALKTIGRNRRWPLFDRQPLVGWVRNRIVLVGDAAHPMLQYLAQGACQALEDAAFMAQMLDAHDSVDRAFLAFQNGRFLRTSMVQTMARYAEEFWHVDGLKAAARNDYLKGHPASSYEEMAWLYDRNTRAVFQGPLPKMTSVDDRRVEAST